ncbi:hypothetical protein CASFOL_011336 [Castilleja foliolosa]|uniref:U-box domain-containing protein n=1 Tax=Castilleja foliolosa TaxID=1961234 RepID=A0ABD3DWK5_9LAMI
MVLEREMEEEDEDDDESMLRKEEEVIGSNNKKDTAPPLPLWGREMMVEEVARVLNHGDLRAKIEAARDVRRLVRKSSSTNSKSAVRCRFAAAGVIEPLVSMLHNSLPLAAREAALLALLNLAARNQRNKTRIVTAGAITPLVELLKYQTDNLRELSAAAILSLSSVSSNKPTIVSSGASVLLVQVLCTGSVQGQVDAITALYNLSTSEDEPKLNLDAKAVPPLIKLLKECKKYSKFAEKTTSLLEIFSGSEEGRNAITNVDGGILALVETVEDGSSISMCHAVGTLLSLCKSSREKYRPLILKEGAIPGLLRLTAEGSLTAQDRARALLDLLRDSPPEKRMLTSSELERIVYDFAAHIDGTDRAVETAKKLLRDMDQKKMEMSLRSKRDK